MEASERAGCPRKLLSIPSDLYQEYASNLNIIEGLVL
jgi:hypothetical protein